MFIGVRGYRPSDKRKVQEICLRAASDNDDLKNWYSDGANFILTTYNNYYLEKEPENCFVAVDENDSPIGYIICAADVDEWRRVFMKEYFPRLKGHKRGHKLNSTGEILIKSVFKRKYPAHLHIDMAKDYRGKGIGTKMMEALTQHLREKGVKGVQLTCGADNDGAVRFYTRFGFKVLNKNRFGVTLGLSLKD